MLFSYHTEKPKNPLCNKYSDIRFWPDYKKLLSGTSLWVSQHNRQQHYNFKQWTFVTVDIQA